MPEYGFSLTRNFPYEDKIVDSGNTGNTDHIKLVFWDVFRSEG